MADPRKYVARQMCGDGSGAHCEHSPHKEPNTMHPLLTEKFADAHSADLRAESRRSRQIRTTRPLRRHNLRRTWWRRDRT
jgi:hypothetical protein